MRIFGLALGIFVVLGCSGHGDRPPYYQSSSLGTGGTGAFQVATTSADCELPPAPDAGLCGNETIPTQDERPNLYFVIDASGSMHDPFVAGETQSKYTAAVGAVSAVLQRIGHRVSYGAAIFPRPNQDTCTPGVQVFATQAGDSVKCTIAGKTGTVLTALQHALNSITPNGGTPLSATMTSLLPILTALPGKTAVILATDGAPNCNPDAVCDADLCQLNLMNWVYQNGLACAAPLNCCDPNFDPSGPYNCVDQDATNQVLASLRDASIATYVVGLPGEPTSATVLDGMAVAGGTARQDAGTTEYYETDDAQALADTLLHIATQLAVSCTIKLSQSPPNWPQVAVYFDNTLIPAFSDDGWQQVDASTLQITGSYCDQLLTGNVYQVQVVADCPVFVN